MTEKADQSRIGLSWSQMAAGALATVTATVAASFLGVAGTLIGAALMSVLTTVGSAVYQHYIRRTGEKLRDVVPLEGMLPGRRPADDRRADPDEGSRGEDGAHEPRKSRDDAASRATSSRGRPRWYVYAGSAAAIFVVVMIFVSVVEGVARKPLSDLVRGRPGGGTTLGRAVGVSSPAPQTPTPMSPPTSAVPSSTASSPPAPDRPGPRASSAAPRPSISRLPTPSNTSAVVPTRPPAGGGTPLP